MSKRKSDCINESAVSERNTCFSKARKQFKSSKGKRLKRKPRYNTRNKRREISKNECFCKPPSKSDIVTENDRIRINNSHQVSLEEWRSQKFQSPIIVKRDDTVKIMHFDPMEFHGHWDLGGYAWIKNTGKTVELSFKDRPLPFLKGGPLMNDDYIFAQLHFHWGADDEKGCEHVFEGTLCTMEAHLVHFNKKYKNFEDASTKHDGLAVVAFFLLATDNTENPDFSKLTKGLPNIIEPYSVASVESDCLAWVKEGAHCKGYYTYQGSLTTKPYNECVTWILYSKLIHISKEQASYFRSLKNYQSQEIKHNIRPVQSPPKHRKLNILYVDEHNDKNCNEK